MVKIVFYSKDNSLQGFEIKGHSGYSEAGSDIVCASISSCVYMVANTITDVIGVDAQISIGDGYMKLMIRPEDAEKVKIVLEGLRLHVKALAGDYTKFISCKTKTIQ